MGGGSLYPDGLISHSLRYNQFINTTTIYSSVIITELELTESALRRKWGSLC